MRSHPIGTGPFKFGEFKPNEYIKVTRNPDYWKKGPALSRWHRVYDHPQSLDGGIGVRCGKVRHDFLI